MFKKKIKNLLALPLLLTPLVLSSCYSPSSSDNGNGTKTIDTTTEENINKFITERTFSLMFSGDNTKSLTFGTGWIFAKEEDTTTPDNYYDDTYYIATNLHVAAAIQNSGKTTYEYDTSAKRYKLVSNPDYQYLSLGQVIYNGNSYSTISNNDIDDTEYNAYLPLSAVSIQYTTFDLFKSMSLTDNYNTYGTNTIDNGTMDLAILKIDLSQIEFEDDSDVCKNYFYSSLDAYNEKPTKFGTYEYGDNISIGGFPAKKEKGETKGVYTSSIHPTPYTNSQVGGNTTNLTISYVNNNVKNYYDDFYKKSGAKSKSDFQQNYVYYNDIAFKTDEYAGYTNTAVQATFNDVGLTGGSSGSMVINDQFEVVGIYWGGYTTTTGYNKTQTISMFDLFVNNYNYTYNNTVSVKKYDIVSDFKNKNNNTNLETLYIN